MRDLLLLIGLICVGLAQAAPSEPINPFVKDAPPPTPQVGAPPGLPPTGYPIAGTNSPPPPAFSNEPLSPYYNDNRLIFDSLTVVGLSARFATLRYPVTGGSGQSGTTSPGMAGSSQQSGQYRVVTVADGAPLWLSGRKYVVRIDADTVRLAYSRPVVVSEKKGKPVNDETVVWAGQLDTPRVVSAPPVIEATK